MAGGSEVMALVTVEPSPVIAPPSAAAACVGAADTAGAAGASGADELACWGAEPAAQPANTSAAIINVAKVT